MNTEQTQTGLSPLVCGGALVVRDITLCHLPYQDAPFVHGWIDTADGPRDVWLRNDGVWTSDEGDERNSLILNDGWNPPKETKELKL